MKRRLFTFALAALTIGLLGSCSKINERIDGLDKRVYDLENEKIASIENQIAAINQSIADLETIRTNIQNLKNAQEAQGQDITDLQAKDQALEGKINDLRTYVDTELSKYATTEWAKATFATLEQLKTTNTELGALKETVGKLGETFDGKLSDLTELTDSINTAVSNLESRISALEARVSAIEAMIQSVSITPAYSDGSVEAVNGILTLKCIVSPAEAISEMESLKDSLLIYADSVKVKTKATTPAYMTIKVSEASVLDAAQGAITLTADISEYLPKGEDKALTVAVNIKNGISDFTTEFVPVYVYVAPAPVAPEGFVDLGVKDANGKPLFWAECNLGASNPQDYGDYFAWGETAPYYTTTGGWPATPAWKEGKTSGYKWDSYCGQSSFVEWSTPPYDATSKILLPAYDAATAANSSWRTPTSEEFEALAASCVWWWTDNYNSTGKVGYIVYKAKNDADKGKANMNGTWKKWDVSQSKYVTDGASEATGYTTSDTHIFFPVAGYGYGTSLVNAGSNGFYWSSSLSADATDSACRLSFSSGNVNLQGYFTRYCGFSVRPVTSGAAPAPAPLPAGALKGVFSVSADKKVYFSQGNLWYGTVGDAQTATFNFEANQYSSASSWEASHVSHFYWSQSVNSAIAEEYDWNGSADDVFFTNATETTAKEGFTVNVNGKNQQGWRTLSTAEWQYLFNNHSKKWATVNGVGGYVIAPDNVTLQAEKTSYTATELNDANLVFLPAAGYRNGSYVLVVGDYGHYWSSTAHAEDYAYFVSFSSPDVTPDDYAYRKFGCSVRLVTDVK